jgi:beta-glucosidase
MRRRSFIGPILISGELLVLLSGGCGHLIKPESSSTSVGSSSSAGGSSSSSATTDTNAGGSSSTGSNTASIGGGTAVALETDLASAGSIAAQDVNKECPAQSMPTEASRPGYNYTRPKEVDDLLSQMSDDDKFMQMYGIETPPDRSSAVYRDIERSENVTLKNNKILRGYMYRDAGRGVNLAAGQNDRSALGSENNFSTAFPCPSIRAASWDVALEMEVGAAIGEETMASKNTMLLAPCMNIIRHPYWGRTQETYSEDMYHTGRMASALTAGLQQHVLACAKHYAANNIENNRFNQVAVMDEQTLREVYTRHFEMVVQDGGVGAVMAAYNSINGKKCTQNKHLLTDILRTDYGFKGLVISDWWATPGEQAPPDSQTAQATAKEAVKAGLDIEVPWDINYSQLGAALEAGDITRTDLDTSVGRILEQKFRFNQQYTDGPYGLGTTDITLSGNSLTNYDKHLTLAEKAEVRSAVLLKNGTGDSPAPVLPIGDSALTKDVKSIAVVGVTHDFTLNNKISDQTELESALGTSLNLATQANIGDRGSSRVNIDPDKAVGPFAGIKAKAASHSITNVFSSENVSDDVKNADLIVVVVGLSAAYEGEEYSLVSRRDRESLDLPLNQADLVAQALDAGKPTVIIVESGSIVNLPWLSHSNQKQATIWAGYGGQRQGDAFAKLLFGEENFSGKMPLAWPKQEDLPVFRDSENGNTTNMGYFFGYRYYDDAGKSDKLVFPFGHGMSYTTFKYENLQLKDSCGVVKESTEAVNFTVDVSNTGARDGDEIIMLFVEGPKPSDIKGKRPVRELKRFHRTNIKAGQGKRIMLPLRVKDLRHWEGVEDGKWLIDKGQYTVKVGPDAGHLTQSITFTIS